jgi:hypothetical protein
MPVPTKYHWNISFQKKCSSKYVVKNTRNVTQFVWQPFSIEFQRFVKKKKFNIYTKGGRRYKRGSDITIFFPKHSFLFFHYHKMNLLYSFIISKILVYILNSFFLTNPWNSIEKGCHTNCVTFLVFLTTYFDEHFFWKEIFQWYFVDSWVAVCVFGVFFCNELIK